MYNLSPTFAIFMSFKSRLSRLCKIDCKQARERESERERAECKNKKKKKMRAGWEGRKRVDVYTAKPTSKTSPVILFSLKIEPRSASPMGTKNSSTTLSIGHN